MEKEILREHIRLHIILFVLGFTAILGKLISIQAFELVWYRMMIAAAAMFIIILVAGKKWLLPARGIVHIAGIGVVVALHWIAFFHAIKVSNVSVTLCVLSTATLFTGILEPLTQKRRIIFLDIVTGLVIIICIYLIYQFETRYFEGIIFALLASLLATVFSVLNKNISTKYEPRAIAFWEMFSGFATVSLFLLIMGFKGKVSLVISWSDLLYLMLLGVICTAVVFAETVSVMKKLSAYVVVLVINLETIYGIVLGFVIFGESERMTAGFYTGAAIILLTVFMYPWLKRKLQKNNEE